MFHRTDFGGFLVCCYKAIQQLNGAEKNYVAISLMLNHNLTGLEGEFATVSLEFEYLHRKSRYGMPVGGDGIIGLHFLM